MSLSDIDRILLDRCLEEAPRAWQDFVDRFLGLVAHVATHTAARDGRTLDDATRDDLIAEVFLTLVANDFLVLRRFRRNCSLATYLTVIARRVVVRRLMARTSPPASGNGQSAKVPDPRLSISRIDDKEEVQMLMSRLEPQEASVVRMYHLEGKSYQEISRAVGMNENSIGPMLTRARAKMKQ